ncbi:MAG: hypothetical protein A2428_17985 [Bdellovibrionales bacterium RIFOXYC1_FULL_54_43]|nr:MAG: hypothetical protein A2428_17985 [Bdellovibrionales bacterium RIFOXYC1_FULL_54_43]OFZ79712.1 MAG: hypothetical protein A2603_06175 [Bdellovibrionales bacterium RIFOXYD1_FULL_55_31]
MRKENEQKNEVPRIIYYREIKKLTGLSRSTIWKLEKTGAFPRRRLVTTNRVGWIESEVHSWIRSRHEVEGSPIQPTHNLPQNRAAAPSAVANSPTDAQKRPNWMNQDDE